MVYKSSLNNAHIFSRFPSFAHSVFVFEAPAGISQKNREVLVHIPPMDMGHGLKCSLEY